VRPNPPSRYHNTRPVGPCASGSFLPSSPHSHVGPMCQHPFPPIPSPYSHDANHCSVSAMSRPTVPTRIPLIGALIGPPFHATPPLHIQYPPAAFPRRLGHAASHSRPHRRGQGHGALTNSCLASAIVGLASHTVQRTSQQLSLCLRPSTVTPCVMDTIIKVISN
jgi:hypothetical protein